MSDTTKTAENVIPRRRASDWQPPASLTEHTDGSVTLSRERLNACLEATYELEALANILSGLGDTVMTVKSLERKVFVVREAA